MATIYAITPRGIGKRPAVRAITDTWALGEGETFSVQDPPTGTQVLSDNGLALREMTPEEIALEQTAADDKEVEVSELTVLFNALEGPFFAALRRASPSAIDNLIATHFDTFTQQQQNVIKFLLKSAVLQLRRMR